MSAPPVSIPSSSPIDTPSSSDPSSSSAVPSPPSSSSSNPALNTLIGLVLHRSLHAIDRSVENVFHSQDQLGAQLDRLSAAIAAFHSIQKNIMNIENNSNTESASSLSSNNNQENNNHTNGSSSSSTIEKSEIKSDHSSSPSPLSSSPSSTTKSPPFPPLSSYSNKISSAKKRIAVLQKSLGVIKKRIESMKDILLKKYPPIPNNQFVSGRTNSASNPPTPALSSQSLINEKKINGEGGGKGESTGIENGTEKSNDNMADYDASIRRSTAVIEELVDWNSS